MKLIYVVEDHQVIREGVKRYLENAGYNVLSFANISSEREAVTKKKPDLIIQDVMLPDGNGFDFIQSLKKEADVPVVFMTAKIAEEDRIHGFELGADDYITKPFSPKELVLRVQAIFRRLNPASTEEKVRDRSFKADDATMVFSEVEHSVKINGEAVSLTSAEWRILKLFIDNASIILPRADILSKCFDYNNTASYERIADTHIKNLRAKLGPYHWIETVRGYGYRFIGFTPKSEV